MSLISNYLHSNFHVWDIPTFMPIPAELFRINEVFLQFNADLDLWFFILEIIK